MGMGIKDYFVSKMLKRWEQRDAKILSVQTLPEGIKAICDIPYADDGLKGHLLDILS